jgi:serine/threonine protein kinase
MDNLIGLTIGRYHIIERLGEGGMATVYKAFDTRLERDVAIKFIRRDAFSNEVIDRILKRFEREAKTLARLSHPNIVKLYDYGEHEGSPYLVMEYIPGGMLKLRSTAPMPWQEAVRLLLPVAHALSYAHEENVIHRDIKPANILLTSKGHPMLSDFGVAKILDVETGSTLTGTNVGIGTPEYMAPEQWMNKVSPQTDIYALGIVFFELVTGQKPYTADTPAAVLLKQASDLLPRPKAFVKDIPDEVEQVIFKALEKKPENRYQTIDDLAMALEKLLVNVTLTGLPFPTLDKNEAKPVQGMATFYEEFTPAALDDVTKDYLPRHPAPGLKGGKRRWWISAAGLGVIGLLVTSVFAIKAIFGTAATETPLAQLEPGALQTSSVSEIPAEPSSPANTSIPEPTHTPALGISWAQVSVKDGMTLVYVPEGEFIMGWNDGDDDEKPVHTVWLDAFWIDRTEVTNAMYEKCISAGACSPSSCSGSNAFNGSDQPVVCVNWNDASIYCGWAGRRLPTEAEWEKAARGTDGRIYPWGEQSPDAQLMNYNQNIGKTSTVGSYPEGASPYGALDMAGNAWEWTADWYGESYYSSSPDRNPEGPGSGGYRVLRGGSWVNVVDLVRASNRFWFTPDDRLNFYGFRCAASR